MLKDTLATYDNLIEQILILSPPPAPRNDERGGGKRESPIYV